MATKKQFKSSILLVVIALLLSGCASGLYNIKPGQIIDVSGDKSVVFGKVAFRLKLGGDCRVVFKNIESGKTRAIYATDGPLYLFKKNKEWNGFVEENFYVELPPGNYTMAKIYIMEFDQSSISLDPEIYFSVAPNAVTYIGTLKYEFQELKDYFFVKKVRCILKVYDESEMAIRELRERYPDLKGNVRVDLMRLPEQ